MVVVALCRRVISIFLIVIIISIFSVTWDLVTRPAALSKKNVPLPSWALILIAAPGRGLDLGLEVDPLDVGAGLGSGP